MPRGPFTIPTRHERAGSHEISCQATRGARAADVLIFWRVSDGFSDNCKEVSSLFPEKARDGSS